MDLRNLALSGLVTVGLGALVPIATGKVLGEYVPSAQKSLIVQVSLAVMITSVVSAAFMLLQNLTVLRMEGRIESTLQPAVWDRLLRLPTKFFTERSTGELASAAMGISAIRRVLSGLGPVAVQSTTIGAMNLVLLLCYSVPLALAAIGMLIVIGAVFLGHGPVGAALAATAGQARQQAQQPGVPDPARAAQAAGRRGRELRVRGLGPRVRPLP